MSLSGTWDARKDHCGFGYEVSTALPVLQPASPCDALGACPLSIFLEVLTFFTRVACPPQLPLAPVRADARAPALLALAPEGGTGTHTSWWLAQAQWLITEMESELTAVEQPGAKCCFFMPNCFLKRHTMSRQADGTWAGTCVTVAP